MNKNNIDEVKLTLGFSCCFSVDSVGRSGGIAMLWKDSLKIQVSRFSRNFIDLEIDEDGRGKWRLTDFYGCLENHRRRKSWSIIRSLAGLSGYP